jgi:DNA-binding transcriptional MerR regulator
VTIGKLARAAGVRAGTLRYYERLGLLAPAARSMAGYRMYPAGMSRRLRFIRRAQALGFSLQEVAELLALSENPRASAKAVKDLTLRKTVEIAGRIAQLERLKEALQPVDRVVQLINPILRGWVQYFAVGHASECFSYIKDWVDKKVRRHMLRARKRRGFGWKQWSRQWLYETLGLFNSYRVSRATPKVAPAG